MLSNEVAHLLCIFFGGVLVLMLHAVSSLEASVIVTGAPVGTPMEMTIGPLLLGSMRTLSSSSILFVLL